ncbi:hypothetical protein ILYODFUR_038870, partial [Ilyodon furcidens]
TDLIQTQRPTFTPGPKIRKRTLLFISLGLTAALMVLLMMIIWSRKKGKKNKTSLSPKNDKVHNDVVEKVKMLLR